MQAERGKKHKVWGPEKNRHFSAWSKRLQVLEPQTRLSPSPSMVILFLIYTIAI